MDSYIVRIYRRDPKNPKKTVGVVERAEGEGKRAFHDLEELMSVLALPGPDQRRSGSRKKGKGK